MGLSLPSFKKIEDIIGQGLGNVGNTAERFVGIHPTFNQPQQQQRPAQAPPVVNQINQVTGFNNTPVQMSPLASPPIPPPAPVTFKSNLKKNLLANVNMLPGGPQVQNFIASPQGQQVGQGVVRGAANAGTAIVEGTLGGGSAGETFNNQGQVIGVGRQETPAQLVQRALITRATLGIGPGGKAVQGAAGVGIGVPQVVQGVKQFNDAKTTQDKTAAAIQAATGGVIALGGAGALAHEGVKAATPSNAVRIAATKAAAETPAPVKPSPPSVTLKPAQPVSSPVKAADLPQVNPRSPEAAVTVPNSGSLTQIGRESADALGLSRAQALNAQSGLGETVRPAPAPVETGLPAVDKAVGQLHQFYGDTPLQSDLPGILRGATGRQLYGGRLAKNLEKAISKELSPEEDLQLRNLEDGHITEADASPKVVKIAQAKESLNHAALNVRLGLDPTTGVVENYSTRVLRSRPKAERLPVEGTTRAGMPTAGRINNYEDLLNTNSRFSQGRQIGKFVDEQGNEHFGTSSELGLKRNPSGTYTGPNGETLTRESTTAQQLENAGVAQYEKRGSTIAGIYHTDTTGLKARQDAITALKDKLVPATEDMPKGHREIENVPELAGYSASAKVATQIERKFGPGYHSSIIGQAYDRLSRAIVQTIVANPLFHGANQELQALIAAGKTPLLKGGRVQSGPVGSARLLARQVTNLFTKGRAGRIDRYLNDGGHIPQYGVNNRGILYKALDKLNVGGLTKLSPKGMRYLESGIRSDLYDLEMRRGMDSRAALQNIDHYLGDANAMGKVAQRALLFSHYFKTMGGAILGHFAHPIAEAGPTVSALSILALYMAVNEGWKEVTGNPDAKLRLPGELGTAEQVIRAPGEIAQGKIPGIVRNHVNPIASTGAQLVANRDFTKPVVGPGSLDNNIVGPGKNDAAKVTARTLLGPANTVQHIQGEQASGPEAALGYLAGAYTPHAKGYEAAPNIPGLNTANAKSGNGLADQTAYFNARDKAISNLSKGPGGADNVKQLQDYLSKSRNDQGQNIQNEPKDSVTNAKLLWNNDNLRNEVQKFEQAQKSHDPKWDLSPDQLKIYEDYEQQFSGDAQKAVIAERNPWIANVVQKQQDFYNSLPPSNSAQSQFDKDHPYPNISPGTQNLLNQMDNLDSAGVANLFKQHPELTDAVAQLHDYTNARRINEGALPLKGSAPKDPETQKILAIYNALPKGNGPNGTSPARSAWIKANPDAWAKMTKYLSESSVNSLIKNVSKAQFEGTDLNQTALKDIKNVGQYDIVQNPNGQLALAGSSQAAPGALNSNEIAYNKQKVARASYSAERVARNALRRSIAKSGRVKLASGRTTYPNKPRSYGVGTVTSKSKRVAKASKGFTRPKVSLKQNVG